MKKVLIIGIILLIGLAGYYASPWQPRLLRANLGEIIPAGKHANIAVIGIDDKGLATDLD